MVQFGESNLASFGTHFHVDQKGSSCGQDEAATDCSETCKRHEHDEHSFILFIYLFFTEIEISSLMKKKTKEVNEP